ncbi:FadR family transcriptional regulator [Cereibacter sphaeroides]|nr:FadR family transcriptional regulator [Cereibacter sphaeroides]
MSTDQTAIPPRPGRTPLAERTYHALYARITGGDYPANERMPSENQLAAEMNVSRPVLREALKRLREEGLLYARQGAGNFVRPTSPAPVGFARVETLADIQRCYEFRLSIETVAATCAAERRNAPALARLTEALEMMRVATGDRQHREDADFAFHLAIAEASNNHYFVSSMRALREHINVGMKLHGDSLLSDGPDALQAVFAEHAAIAAAIAEGQGEKAATRVRRHLEQSRDRLFGGGLLDLRMRGD